MKNLTDLKLLKFPTNSFAFFTQSQDLVKNQTNEIISFAELCGCVFISRSSCRQAAVSPLNFPSQALRLLQKTNLQKC